MNLTEKLIEKIVPEEINLEDHKKAGEIIKAFFTGQNKCRETVIDNLKKVGIDRNRIEHLIRTSIQNGFIPKNENEPYKIFPNMIPALVKAIADSADILTFKDNDD